MGPSGGPKDSLAPVVLKVEPKNGQTGFNGKLVQVFCNEYLKLKDKQKNFSVSPPMEKSPIYRTKGKSVRVEFEDTLKPNTTYIIDFGNSITDNNEGNVLEDYRVVFSTGGNIDMGRIKGRVADAFTLDPVEGASVFLYENNVDSLPLKQIPDAIAKVSPRGFFIADGLKEGKSYKLMAVEDKNSNNKYDPDVEKAAFLTEPIIAQSMIHDSTSILTYEKDSLSNFDDMMQLRLFNENTQKQFLSTYKRVAERKVELCFVRHYPEILSLKFDGIDSTQLMREQNFWKDTLSYWLTADSIPAGLVANITYMRPDTTGVIAPFDATLKFEEWKDKASARTGRRAKESEEKEPTPAIKAEILTNGDLVTQEGLTLKLPAPLKSFDSTKVCMYKYRDTRDTVKTRIPCSVTPDPKGLCYYRIQAKFETSEAYEVVIDSLAMLDIYGLHNAHISKRIETPNEAKFGIFIFEMSNVSGSYIMQLIKDKKVVREKVFNSNGAQTFSFLTPGDYRVRFINDENGNEHWDTGIYLEHQQPEPVVFLKHEGKGTISLKPNWDVKLKVDMRLLFEPFAEVSSQPENSN